MSDNKVGICGECGQLKPMQKLHCIRHDFVYNPGEHCDHCEDEFIKSLMENSAHTPVNADKPLPIANSTFEPRAYGEPKKEGNTDAT